MNQMDFSDFAKLKETYFTSIRAGKKVGDPTVSKVSMPWYHPDGKFECKLFRGSSEWNSLPTRFRSTQNTVEWLPMYTNCRSISKRKFDDLQSMKAILPKDVHAFYDALSFQ